MAKSVPNPGELRELIDGYFDRCDDDGTFATISGLIRYLGFDSKVEFMELGNKRSYEKTIDYALLRIEELYEKRASMLKNPSGPIFILKSLGWDKPIVKEPENNKKKSISIKIVR